MTDTLSDVQRIASAFSTGPQLPQKLCIGFPIYNQVPSEFFFRWLQMDQRHVSHMFGVDHCELITANKKIVKQALEVDGWDRLVIFEGDMMVPPTALIRIAHSHRPQTAIVGSVYFQHFAPHYPVAYVEWEGAYRTLSSKTVQEWCAAPALYQVDAVGFGLTSIARHVLEDWDPAVPMFAVTDDHLQSHDLHFCNEAKKQGHHIFLDTGIVCDHLTSVSIGAADNQRCADTDAEVADFDYADGDTGMWLLGGGAFGHH